MERCTLSPVLGVHHTLWTDVNYEVATNKQIETTSPL